MKHPNEIEEEVDAIRDSIYSTIKDMTSVERVEYINARAWEIMKKHGISANNSMEEGQASKFATNDMPSSP